MTARRGSDGGRSRPTTALLSLTVLGAGLLVGSRVTAGSVDLLAEVPTDGVVATDIPGRSKGGGWLVTSGTLVARDGVVWSGDPDQGPPDGTARTTGSAVLRAVTSRDDFTDGVLDIRMRLLGLSATARTPAEDWDGVHVFVRYRDPENTYTVDLVRRDGGVTIKRKRAAADGGAGGAGTYTTLASGRLGVTRAWRDFAVTMTDIVAGPQLSLAVDGRTVLSVVDDSDVALRGRGRLGLRGDNAEFEVSTLSFSHSGRP